jgi:hypothetical protein
MHLSRTKLLVASAIATVGISAVAVPASLAGPSSGARTTATSASVPGVGQSKAGTLTSAVHGTFTGGTVQGTFKPLRSFVYKGQTYVQGNLAATLVKTDGTVLGHATRHDVALPVKAPGAGTAQPAATCPILHLVLGPLTLNLLGLNIHLNRVVLNITAVSGPGNLLGNLLCLVAHLLDNTGATLGQLLNLSNLLNQIIGILT